MGEDTREARYRISEQEGRHLCERVLLAQMPSMRSPLTQVECGILEDQVREQQTEGHEEQERPGEIRMEGLCGLGMRIEGRFHWMRSQNKGIY